MTSFPLVRESQLPKEEEIVATAKEIQRHVRGVANLPCDWNKQSEEMKRWYMMLARRIERLEDKVQ